MTKRYCLACDLKDDPNLSKNTKNTMPRERPDLKSPKVLEMQGFWMWKSILSKIVFL